MSEAVKMIRLTLPDGSVWQFPAELVAKNRAAYYAEKEGEAMRAHEFAVTMRDDSTLVDWAQNNMNWSDVAPHAERVEERDLPDFDEAWGDSDNWDVETVQK